MKIVEAKVITKKGKTIEIVSEDYPELFDTISKRKLAVKELHAKTVEKEEE